MRPTGHQTEWRYSSRDEVHVFVGERAVVNFAFESGLLKAPTDAKVRPGDDSRQEQGKEEDGDDGQQESAFEEVVRPSQIDTGVLLSQNTIDEMLAPPK
ncbi:hypothetical protein PF005_g3745 [Phytophthora fragariae]|uniref:Uncharacterized protein n=1 Tax=Phytophthora fragariae TaxID=53985 RepID=A0A6A3Z5W6_9STRA|nr:hypothetical protein PF005_g3745 [Phytophthora fragariae]KAE9251697.1 hypothetical protein PF002_g4183 [Phytophthora fragariae]KAE9320332.1 hypothetical protein PF001_g5464 [Phytophthora fragariae]